MADPICRWRNPKVETVCELVNSMPHTEMSKDEFRNYMAQSSFGNDFFRTAYQLACQLGLYYESDDNRFIPRFYDDIDEVIAKSYLKYWIHRYYVPNPYTKRGFNYITEPIFLVNSIVRYIEDNPISPNITNICNHIFKEETGNKDILINVLNNFSNVIKIDKNGNTTLVPNYKNIINQYMDRNDKKIFFDTVAKEISKKLVDVSDNVDSYNKFFISIRTKPFILLAGISGTGKSRLVRELAYMSCPNIGNLRKDTTSPGNYCMIEVKPNWHDSSELLGYISGIQGRYVVTPFVKFLVKAMRYPEVPFFVCLDELNLAPVEQYFAEYLSVLETRKKNDDVIISGSLISKDIFIKYSSEIYKDKVDIYEDLGLNEGEYTDSEELIRITAIKNELEEFGLSLPQNVIVIGTVNMDDTTHQFSRKVIDRAMTIEMNHVDFNGMFNDIDHLQYIDNPIPKELFISDCTNAKQALEFIQEDAVVLKEKTIEIMQYIDKLLQLTPFRIAYRVQNEMIIYFRNIRLLNPETEFETLLGKTIDAILNMKVLPRIEGDEDLVGKPLKDLETWCKENNYSSSLSKIKEMLARLERTHYTSYWP